MTQPLICSASEPTRIYGSDLDATEGPNHAETSCTYRCYDNNNEPKGCAGSFKSDDDFPLATDEVSVSGYCSADGDHISAISLAFNSECGVPLFNKGVVTLERNESGIWNMKARQSTNVPNSEYGIAWTFCKPDYVIDMVIIALQCFQRNEARADLAVSIEELVAQKQYVAQRSPHYEKEDDCVRQLSPASSSDDVMPMRD